MRLLPGRLNRNVLLVSTMLCLLSCSGGKVTLRGKPVAFILIEFWRDPEVQNTRIDASGCRGLLQALDELLHRGVRPVKWDKAAMLGRCRVHYVDGGTEFIYFFGNVVRLEDGGVPIGEEEYDVIASFFRDLSVEGGE